MPSVADELMSRIEARKYDHFDAAKIKSGSVSLSPEEAVKAAGLAAANAQHLTLDALHTAYPNAVTPSVYEDAIKGSMQRDLLVDNILNENAAPKSSTSSMFQRLFAPARPNELRIYDSSDIDRQRRDQSGMEPNEHYTAITSGAEPFDASRLSKLSYKPSLIPAVNEAKKEPVSPGFFNAVASLFNSSSGGRKPPSLPPAANCRLPIIF